MSYLKRMEIKNFGGIAQLNYDFDPKINIIESAYGTGKSSLKNAIYWVSGFNVDFEPLIESKKIVGLETSVKCIYDKAGKNGKKGTEFSFERTAKQIYKPKQGEIDIKVFDKYDYKYLFDGCALKSGDYEKRLTEFFEVENKEELQIMLDFEFFNSNNGTKWDKAKRQQYLFKIFDIDNKVETMTKEYDLIADDILKSKLSEEEIKNNLNRLDKNLKEKQAKNNILIESKNTEKSNLLTIDFESFKKEKEFLEKEIAQMQSEKIDTTTASEISKNYLQLSALKNEISKIGQEYQKENRDYNFSLSELKNNLEKLENEKKICDQKIERLASEIEDYGIEIDEVETQVFDEKKNTCPTCKQELPQEEKDRIINVFAEQKTKQLADLRSKTEKATIEQQNTQTRTNTLLKSITATKAKTKTLMGDKPVQKETDHILKNIQDLQSKIDILRLNETIAPLENIIKEKQNNYDNLVEQIAKEKTIKKLENEIILLKDENRDLANKDNERLRKLMQFIEYKKRKNEMVNSEINNNFIGVNFNFIEQQGSGSQFGEKETCECQMGGIAYSNLSGGQQVLADFYTNLSLRKIRKINMPQLTDEICRITNDLEKIEELFEVNQYDWQTIYFVTQDNEKLLITLIKDMYTEKDCDLSLVQ